MKNYKLLKTLLVLIGILIGSVISPMYATGNLVYFKNGSNAGKPHVYFWGGSPSTTWDGCPEMYQMGTSDIYYYDIGSNTDFKVRYNNTSTATSDLSYSSGNYHDASNHKCIVFFDNTSAKWNTVKAYTYDPNESLGSWAGTAMTALTGVSNIYYIAANSRNKIIFNCGSSSCQTGNLDFVKGALYNKDGKVSDTYEEAPSVSLAASPTTVYCGEDITYTATPSKLNGRSATYTFTDITGGGSTTIQSASESTTCTHSFTTSGTKRVQVTMTVNATGYTSYVDVTIKTCYVRGNINSHSWDDPYTMTYAVSESGVAYYYYQVTSTGQFKILVGNSAWGDQDKSHERDGDDIDNSILGADIDLGHVDGDNPNITIDRTGYIVYFPDVDKICATSDLNNFDGANIDEVALSESTVPPLAVITATPTMSARRDVDQAFCWGVYSDEDCEEEDKIATTFTSLGDGKVEFMVPKTTGTYYLKLKVHASDDCEDDVDDEEVVSFTVTTTNMIYFKNVPNWSNVYVYFYYGDGANGYWDSSAGTGAKKNGSTQVCSASTMKRIGKTDIYYYQYNTWSGHVVAFADHEENNNQWFDQCQVAYREDYSSCAPMFVPENWITDYLNQHDGYRACYYTSGNNNKKRGYWTTYPRGNAGYSIKLYSSSSGSTQIGDNIEFSQTGANTYRATVSMDPSSHETYYYDLYECAGASIDNSSYAAYIFYGNNGTMTVNDHANWKFYPQCNRCAIKPTANGNYYFNLLLSDDGYVEVTVEYPVAVGDYRLLYTDGDHVKPHPSRYIRARADGKDTISVWINPGATSPVLKVQKCSKVSPSVKWDDYNWSGSDATGAINITSYSKGVYNFYLTQNESKALTVQTSKTAPYTGLYYIRTNSVGGGWLGYKTNIDNQMSYTKYAEDQEYGFNYYKTKWVNDAGSDVTYTIACDYSESLCDTLFADKNNDPLNASQAVSIPHNANIRFGWNSLDNTLQRAYINGSSNASDRYLVLLGEENKIADTNESAFSVYGLNANETTFTDLNNWIYRLDLKAKPNAGVKVTANYNGEEQYFIGTSSSYKEIIGSSDDQWWPLRVTYDFKTNRLMTAWLPNGSAITSNIVLDADMMLIRKGQNAATQVYFGEGKKDKTISEIQTIYGVLEFQYDSIVNQFSSWSSTNAYKYLMYYISFPFDVKVSEIFGCGTRGTNWIIQKYNGAKRAQIGWFAETSTFWETLPGDSTLHAYEGYLLILDRVSFNDGGSKIWENLKSGNSVYLYFPSESNTIGTISDDDKEIHVPEHTCTINRSFNVDGIGSVNHKNTDSHWNVIGTPLFETTTASTIGTPAADGDGATTLKYYYAWNSASNTLAVKATFDDEVTFKSMHGYMVQYAGDVTFHGASIYVPSSIVARRIPGEKKNYRIKLRMENETGMSSDAFVELCENACDTFALNEDVYMMRSSTTVDLYTFAGNYDVAANVLSMNNHIVPVGMDVKRAGTYRFTMPSEFSGTVILIDTETGVRTNLALSDYEVALPKGTSNTRFLLEIDIQQMPTAIDGVGGSLKDGKAHKFIQNGQMYILQNGIIYDTQGRKMK